MKSVLTIAAALAALATPGLAAAQAFPSSGPQGGMNLAPPTGDFRTAAESRFFQPVRETPTMQRQRAEQALAVRAEAERLRLEDGGTLSAENRNYIARKVRRILERR